MSKASRAQTPAHQLSDGARDAYSPGSQTSVAQRSRDGPPCPTRGSPKSTSQLQDCFPDTERLQKIAAQEDSEGGRTTARKYQTELQKEVIGRAQNRDLKILD